MVVISRRKIDGAHPAAIDKIDPYLSGAPGQRALKMAAIDLKTRHVEVVAGTTLQPS